MDRRRGIVGRFPPRIHSRSWIDRNVELVGHQPISGYRYLTPFGGVGHCRIGEGPRESFLGGPRHKPDGLLLYGGVRERHRNHPDLDRGSGHGIGDWTLGARLAERTSRGGTGLGSLHGQLFAAASKASSLQFTLGSWEFDANSIYHLAQIPGLFLLLAAIQRRAGILEDQPARQIANVAAPV